MEIAEGRTQIRIFIVIEGQTEHVPRQIRRLAASRQAGEFCSAIAAIFFFVLDAFVQDRIRWIASKSAECLRCGPQRIRVLTSVHQLLERRGRYAN